MFETFQVPAVHIATQAVLALYSVHAVGKLERSVSSPENQALFRLLMSFQLIKSLVFGLCFGTLD
jgi:actin-related protein